LFRFPCGRKRLAVWLGLSVFLSPVAVAPKCRLRKQNFQAFNFAVGFTFSGTTVIIDFPVLYQGSLSLSAAETCAWQAPVRTVLDHQTAFLF
jgi:hypothetical protein